MISRLWIFMYLSACIWSCRGDLTTESKNSPELVPISAESVTEGVTTTKEANEGSVVDVDSEGKGVDSKISESTTTAVKDDAEEKKRDVEKPDGEKGSETPTSKIEDRTSEAVSTTESEVKRELAAENKSCVVSNQTQWSWLVKVVDKETKKHVCTGTLITDEDVLIPASCFLENTTDIPETFYEIGSKLLAIAGGGINYNCMQIRNVTVIYPHKGYFESSEEHDYAFLKVIPEFDVDDEDIPDLRYHLNVINSEGGLVNIHNNGPFCESPYFVDDGFNNVVAEERHLLGIRIDDCMLKWNCSADFDTCLSYLHPAHYSCLKPLTPRNCSSRDKGAPLVCDDVFLGYLHLCDGELPMIFRGLNKAIKFLELEEDHIQQPGYMGRRY